MKWNDLKFLSLSAILVFIFSACASPVSPLQEEAKGSETPSTQAAAENPLSPGNLPPPSLESEDTVSALQTNSSIFFQRKEVWDTFSEELKSKVWESYARSADLNGAGPGGAGYFNTLFGRVSPVKKLPAVSVQKQKSQKTLKNLPVLLLAQMESSVAFCESFICIDSPVDGLNTVFDSVIVSGRIRMDQAALFSPDDPLIMVSVFKQSGESVAQDIPVYARDVPVSLVLPPLSGSEDPNAPLEAVEIGVFNHTVPLAGAGKFTIVLTAFQESGGSVLSQPLYFEVYRQDNPKIELYSLTPPETGNQMIADVAHRRDEVRSGDEVSMLSVEAKVKIAALSPSAVQSNVGIIFQNYDVDGNLRYVTSGEPGFSKVSAEDETPIKIGKLTLFDGYNKFVITAHNQQLDDFYRSMNLPLPPPQRLEFSLINHLPQAGLKMISPADGAIVEPNGQASIPISFCITGLPNLPGRPVSYSGECLQNWSGDMPAVTFNNYIYGRNPSSQVSYNASTGIFTFNAKPLLGANLIKISLVNKNYLPAVLTQNEDGSSSEDVTGLGNFNTSFSYGKLNRIFENGQLKEKDNFLQRGLSLEIHKSVLEKDVKKMLLAFLNKPEFKETFITAFKKDAPGETSICSEGGEYTVDTGDTTLNILPETLKLGSFEIMELTPGNDNKLHIAVRLNGFNAQADLRGLNSNVRLVHDGVDYGFIPLSITLNRLTLRATLNFKKDEKGYSLINLTYPVSGKLLELEGGDALKNSVHVNSNRNPYAAAIEAKDVNGGLLQTSFEQTLTKTVVCGLEKGLNNPTTGLAQWREDLLKLVSYNNLNPFRIPVEFEMLNKLVGIDLAYDVLKGDIQFSDRGVHIKNVPLRITPSPRVLSNLAEDIKNSFIGSLSVPTQNPEMAATLPHSDENRNFSLSLSEDAINQAIAAASLSGMLDLEIDPNFYTNNEIPFIAKVTPDVRGMFDRDVDLNQNGVADDRLLPVQMKVRMNPSTPPNLHFLSKSEIEELAQKVAEYDQAATAGSSDVSNKALNKDLHYFRLSISNLDLSFYRVVPVPRELGGYKNYCSLSTALPEPGVDTEKRAQVPTFRIDGNSTDFACSQSLSSTIEKMTATCPTGYEAVEIPVRNGPVLSAVEGSSTPLPVVRMKVDLVLYGVFQGIYREVLAADQYHVDPNAPEGQKLVRNETPATPTNFLRMRIVTGVSPADVFSSFRVIENRTAFSGEELSNQLGGVILPFALTNPCENFNEIRIPIPDRIPSVGDDVSESMSKLLNDFGIHHFNLGEDEASLPALPFMVQTDPNGSASNPLYLDMQAHLSICYLNEDCQ